MAKAHPLLPNPTKGLDSMPQPSQGPDRLKSVDSCNRHQTRQLRVTIFHEDLFIRSMCNFGFRGVHNVQSPWQRQIQL